MMRNSLILLKTLLRSSSLVNVFRHSKDPGRKRKTLFNILGILVLYGMLMTYSYLACVGYGMAGLGDSIPEMCAIAICSLSLFLTFVKAGGYLFAYREYDLLMSLPFAESDIAATRAMYMYLKDLPWYLSLSLAMLAGYGRFGQPDLMACILWIILSFFLPVIPMLAAALFSYLSARYSIGFKNRKLVQMLLSLLIVVFSFTSSYIVRHFFEAGKAIDTLGKITDYSTKLLDLYRPGRWFVKAVTEKDAFAIFLLPAVSLLLFVLLFRLVGKNYRKINSALRSESSGGHYSLKKKKKRSVLNAIAFKEYRRMIGSVTYTTNAALGEMLAGLLGICSLVFGIDRIADVVSGGFGFDTALLEPAIPYIVYFLIGMEATTVISPSIEGSNYWIVSSLPIERKTLYQGKMLFNMYLSVPFMLFAVLCLCLSAKTALVDTLLYLILGFALCCFSTAWGCLCGVRFMRLDWENEVEVIKQGTASLLYILPNMLLTSLLISASVYFGMTLDHKLMTVSMIVIVSLFALLSYLGVMAQVRRIKDM